MGYRGLLRRIGLLLTVVLLASVVSGVASANSVAVMVERDVAIPAGDHQIPGTLTMPSRRSGTTVPAVLMLHGFGSQKDEVGDMYARLAEDLAERGYASLRIDFAGASDGAEPWIENNYVGMVEDSRTALDYLIRLRATNDDRIGVLGFSLGTKVAMGLAGTDDRVAAFASWSGSTANGAQDFQFFFDTFYETALAEGSVVVDLGFTVVELSLEWFDTIAASTNLDAMASYTGPLLAVAGEDDVTVDPVSSRELIRWSGTLDATLRILPGADHIFHVLTDDQTLAEQVMTITADWFADKL